MIGRWRDDSDIWGLRRVLQTEPRIVLAGSAQQWPPADRNPADSRAYGSFAEILDTERPTAASTVADAIWPGHAITAQAAALAAGEILGRMQRRGLVGHSSEGWDRIRYAPKPKRP